MKKLVALVMTALCLLAVGCSKQEDDQIIDVVVPSTPEAVVTPVPTPETPAETPAPAYTSPYTEQIAAQKAKNDETVGWIKIQGTNIDYPIMYDATGKLGYSGKDADELTTTDNQDEGVTFRCKITYNSVSAFTNAIKMA